MSKYLTMSISPSGSGNNPKAWKVSGRDAVFSFEARRRVAELAREGGFDSLWLPDLPHHNVPSTDVPFHPFDPQLLMAALAAAVPEIGLVPTVSSTYTDPFIIARNTQTLDRISGGRAGINVIASYSPTVGQNFGDPVVPDYPVRYARAHEYFRVLKSLFGSFRLDPAYGNGPDDNPDLINPDRIGPISFQGEHFKVAGPLPTPQWGEDRPLVATAGGSEYAVELASKEADVMYVVAQAPRASAAFNAQVRRQVVAHGRQAQDLKIVPGVSIVLGSTMQEAQARVDSYSALSGDTATPLERVARLLALPIEELHPDKPLSPAQLAAPSSAFARPIGFFRAITDLAKEEDLSVDQLGRRLQLGIGHRLLLGTPESVADDLQLWHESGAADGFIVHLNTVAGDLPLLAQELMPLLRKRGVVRPGYGSGNLRKRFGLE